MILPVPAFAIVAATLRVFDLPKVVVTAGVVVTALPSSVTLTLAPT